MGLVYLVEPVMAFYCFACFASYPLMQQFVYQRFWEEEFNSTVFYSDNISHCETNQTNPNFTHQKEVQKKSSTFYTTLDLTALFPSLLMALILVSYGDQHGRKASLLLPSAVRLPFLFSAMPLPVLRSMMSKVILENEQGALFACIACLESLTGSLTVAVFNSIYGATVLWFPGFSFLLSAVLSLVPFGLVWLLLCIGYQERDHVLLINEESSPEGES